MLAGIYGELGITERAAPLTDQAFAIHERLYGADSPLVATNLRQKAKLALARGDADTADRFARQALERHRRAYGDLHQDLAEDLDTLLMAARQRGRLPDAIAAAEESLRIRKAIYGNDHLLVADSMNNLAVVRREQGRYEEAAALYRQTIDLRRRLLGPEHPLLALTVHNFAALQLVRGELAAGRRLRTRSAGARPPILWRGPSVDTVGAQHPRQHRSGAGSLRRGGSGSDPSSIRGPERRGRIIRTPSARWPIWDAPIANAAIPLEPRGFSAMRTSAGSAEWARHIQRERSFAGSWEVPGRPRTVR